MLFTWGMEGIDEKDTQPKDIFTAFGQEAWNIGERYVRRNIIGDGFGQPLGTVGGAIESSGRVVSEIHLSKLNF